MPDPPRLTKLKLPEIPLPIYSNAKDETLDQFFENFENIIVKYQLSDYEKFIYLKKQLQGEPLTLISSLSGSKQSFEGAKLLLRKAFADALTQKFAAIKRLSTLKFIPGGDPFLYVSEMRSAQDLFKTLQISIDNVLQYFIWTGLSTALQTQLITICNTNKPTITEINDNVFKAIDRQREVTAASNLEASSKPKSREGCSLQSFAASVPYEPRSSEPRVKFCSLCSTDGNKETSHSTKDCPSYKNAKEKVDRLMSIGACSRCGYSNHVRDNCNFKFRKMCFYCGNDHMSFLCVNNNGHNAAVSSSATPVSKSKYPHTDCNINSGIAWAESSLSKFGTDALLPTFEAKINDHSLRCLKDTGCQGHFIETALAEDLGLPVVTDNFSVTVTGMNERKTYHTNVVSVPIAIGGRVSDLQAVCIPEINTRMKFTGLDLIAQTFCDKGYKLADPSLRIRDNFADVRFILGANDPHVLTEIQTAFGRSGRISVYSETDAGILLYGSTDRLLNNLSFLPSRNAQLNKQSGIDSFVERRHKESDYFEHKLCPSFRYTSHESNHSCSVDPNLDTELLASGIDSMLDSETGVLDSFD